MYSVGNINQVFMIYTGLVVLKYHGTGIHILHGRVNLMKLSLIFIKKGQMLPYALIRQSAWAVYLLRRRRRLV